MEDQVYNNLGLVVEEFLVIPIILSLFSVRETCVESPIGALWSPFNPIQVILTPKYAMLPFFWNSKTKRSAKRPSTLSMDWLPPHLSSQLHHLP